MATHFWMVPASGGEFNSPLGAASINVQFASVAYPSGASKPSISQLARSAWTIASSDAPAVLLECSAFWGWTSAATVGAVTQGVKLAVGTVFAAELSGCDPTTWASLKVWVKYNINNKDRFHKIYFTLDDSSSSGPLPASTDILSGASAGWNLACISFDLSDLSGWSLSNLRAIITFEGTITPANVGSTEAAVEWFAFQLDTETLP